MADAAVHAFLDFEKPIAELEGKIEELRHHSSDGQFTTAEEIERLQARVEKQLNQTYDKLTPWQKVQVARHPARPHCRDYIDNLITDFIPLSGGGDFKKLAWYDADIRDKCPVVNKSNTWYINGEAEAEDTEGAAH